MNKALLLTAMLLAIVTAAFGQTADDYVNNATVKYVHGDVDGAIADESQAIELKPDDAFLYSDRGRLKQVKGDLQGALADFNKALEILPGNARIQGRIDEVKASIAAAAPAAFPETNATLATITTNTATTSQADAQAIQGSWSRTSSALGDSALPAEFLKPLIYKFSDGKYEKSVNGGDPEKGTYTIDPSTSPKNLALTCSEGTAAGTTILCIYQLDGDKLRICVDIPGTTRPASFQSSSTTQLMIESYKRLPAQVANATSN
jgi:uncharacterized protein (TIGR03067 family)